MRTDRLTLRRWAPDDEADVRTVFDIYRRTEVVEWLSRPPAPLESEGAARDRMRRWVAISVDRPGLGMWAVVPDVVGRPVGTVLLLPLPGADGTMTDDAEIGWHLHPEHWGHGYATEAARAALDHAFQDLGLPVVNAIAYEGNTASFGVMRRLGMTHRGRSERWYGKAFAWWTAEPGTTADVPEPVHRGRGQIDDPVRTRWSSARGSGRAPRGAAPCR
jgi:RimJ/RimL family protein N-acetyltransferase